MYNALLDWLKLNWFSFMQSIGIMSTLLLTVYSNSKLVRSRRLTNYLQLIQFHRQIWTMAMQAPELYRVVSTDPSMETVEISPVENQFLTFIFLHITCTFELARDREVISIEGIKHDLFTLFQSPIVRRFWSERKVFYNAQFISFVEESRKPPYSYNTSVYLHGSLSAAGHEVSR